VFQMEKLVAPVYYIVGGSGHNEGVVITRDRKTCLDVWILNSGNATNSKGNSTLLQKWYLLETNYVSTYTSEQW
jgi:acid ceramidase